MELSPAGGVVEIAGAIGLSVQYVIAAHSRGAKVETVPGTVGVSSG
jgi:hypothetical protein